MTDKEYLDLKEGDIVRGKISGLSFVVTGNYSLHVTAIRSVSITSPEDWELVKSEPVAQNKEEGVHKFYCKFKQPEGEWFELPEISVRHLLRGYFSPGQTNMRIGRLKRGEKVETIAAVFSSMKL